MPDQTPESAPVPLPLTVDDQLFDAARKGDVDALRGLLDRHADSRHARAKPYEGRSYTSPPTTVIWRRSICCWRAGST